MIVDLRPGSPTYLKWFGVELNEDNRSMLYIPRGFGHGFITLTDNVEAFYLHSAFYSPEAERGCVGMIRRIRIDWPERTQDMSDKDRTWPDLDLEFHEVEAMRCFYEAPGGPLSDRA